MRRLVGLPVVLTVPCLAAPHSPLQPASPAKRGRGARGGRAAPRSAAVEEAEEEAPPRTAARGRGARRAAEPVAEEEEAGASSDEEGSGKQQGSVLGSILRSAQKAVSRGRRGAAAKDGDQGERWRCGRGAGAACGLAPGCITFILAPGLQC